LCYIKATAGQFDMKVSQAGNCSLIDPLRAALVERKPLHRYDRRRSRLKDCKHTGSIMPRYFFHLTDGNQVLNNHKGIDLSGNAAARADAVALARDLKHGAAMRDWNWTGWFVTIVDQHGHKVDEVPIMDV
jgi:uncharacterized protein DUF6894